MDPATMSRLTLDPLGDVGFEPLRRAPAPDPERAQATRIARQAEAAHLPTLQMAPEASRRRYASLALRAQTSALAAARLRCLDCVNWDTAEAQACTIRTCALWLVTKKAFRRA